MTLALSFKFAFASRAARFPPVNVNFKFHRSSRQHGIELITGYQHMHAYEPIS